MMGGCSENIIQPDAFQTQSLLYLVRSKYRWYLAWFEAGWKATEILLGPKNKIFVYGACLQKTQ
jgi:hypothetical protein